MPAPRLKISNRVCYFRKSISNPDFVTDRVLARDAFDFALLWLKRKLQGSPSLLGAGKSLLHGKWAIFLLNPRP